MLEQLIKSGALDGLPGGHHRAQLLAALDSALERGASEQRDRRSDQDPLFRLFAAQEPARVASGSPGMGELYPEVEIWGPKQLLVFEKEALGFYVSGHPLLATAATCSATRTRRRATFRPASAASAMRRSAASSARLLGDRVRWRSPPRDTRTWYDRSPWRRQKPVLFVVRRSSWRVQFQRWRESACVLSWRPLTSREFLASCNASCGKHGSRVAPRVQSKMVRILKLRDRAW